MYPAQTASIDDSVKEEIKRSIKRHKTTQLVKLQYVSGDVVSVANIHVLWDILRYPALQALQVRSNELSVMYLGL